MTVPLFRQTVIIHRDDGRLIFRHLRQQLDMVRFSWLSLFGLLIHTYTHAHTQPYTHTYMHIHIPLHELCTAFLYFECLFNIIRRNQNVINEEDKILMVMVLSSF